MIKDNQRTDEGNQLGLNIDKQMFELIRTIQQEYKEIQYYINGNLSIYSLIH